jgi:putative ABC transport system permease protein
MDKWLQNFQYRIDMTVWIFALGFGLSLSVALITVSWQSIRAAVINPAESLRYE